jgi:AcrR family transcriptional regulator
VEAFLPYAGRYTNRKKIVQFDLWEAPMAHEAHLRADARRNRQQIVTAALALFREQGIDVPMEEIAARAGVGVGTLYRRFPDRDALIWATAHASLRGQVDMAEAALREEPGAWSALCRFLRECAELRLGALTSAIEPRLHADIQADPELREIRQALIDLIERMTAEAKAEGAMRHDVGREEVGSLMTLQIYTPPHMSNDQALHRVVEIMLDGIRTDPEPDRRETHHEREQSPNLVTHPFC